MSESLSVTLSSTKSVPEKFSQTFTRKSPRAPGLSIVHTEQSSPKQGIFCSSEKEYHETSHSSKEPSITSFTQELFALQAEIEKGNALLLEREASLLSREKEMKIREEKLQEQIIEETLQQAELIWNQKNDQLIADMKAKLKSLKEENKKSQRQLAKAHEEEERTKQIVASMKLRNEALEAANRELTDSLKTQKGRISMLEGSLKRQREQNTKMKQELESKLAILEEENTKLKMKNREFLQFIKHQAEKSGEKEAELESIRKNTSGSPVEQVVAHQTKEDLPPSSGEASPRKDSVSSESLDLPILDEMPQSTDCQPDEETPEQLLHRLQLDHFIPLLLAPATQDHSSSPK